MSSEARQRANATKVVAAKRRSAPVSSTEVSMQLPDNPFDANSVIEAVAMQVGCSVDVVKAYLADDAAQDWPLLRAFLQRGVTPRGKTVAGAAPDAVDES